MFSTRFLSVFLLFISFGLFASAKPIAYAKGQSSDMVARGGSCNYGGCNENALLAVLVDLQAKVNVNVALLDGHKSPYETCNNIIADINAAVAVIADIEVDVSGAHGAQYHQIAVTLVAIINVIIGGCKKYGAIVLVQLLVQLNVCLGALLKVCGGLIGGLLALVGTLIVDIEACINLKLTLVLSLCGLSSSY